MKTIRRFKVSVVREKVDQESVYGNSVNEPSDAVVVIRHALSDSGVEGFVSVSLDIKNRVIGYALVGCGSVDYCQADPREVFRAAIVNGASAVIVGHNHPSGCVTPSTEDLLLTERLKDAGALLGLPLLDHIIVTDSTHNSLAEMGVI